jgi:hypothetical protein
MDRRSGLSVVLILGECKRSVTVRAVAIFLMMRLNLRAALREVGAEEKATVRKRYVYEKDEHHRQCQMIHTLKKEGLWQNLWVPNQ